MCWHIKSRKEITMLKRYLSIRFISCRPSPFRKRSRLELSIRQEQRESNRFSIISCSSAVLGLCRLNTWMTKKAKLLQNVVLCCCRTHMENLHQKLQHLTGVSQWSHRSSSVVAALCCPDCAHTNVQQPGAGYKGKYTVPPSGRANSHSSKWISWLPK